jgi:hypothetical protein
MILLLPADSFAVMFGKTRPTTPEHNALRDAKTTAGALQQDKVAVVCDIDTAERLLMLAHSHCPDAVAVIQEGLSSAKGKTPDRD